MCQFVTFGFILPIPGFSPVLPRRPDLAIIVDLGFPIQIPSLDVLPPLPGFALGLPRFPDLSLNIDIGIPLSLRVFGVTLPVIGFSLVPIKIIDFQRPTCPLE